jgi:hypothetical protein
VKRDTLKKIWRCCFCFQTRLETISQIIHITWDIVYHREQRKTSFSKFAAHFWGIKSQLNQPISHILAAPSKGVIIWDLDLSSSYIHSILSTILPFSIRWWFLWSKIGVKCNSKGHKVNYFIIFCIHIMTLKWPNEVFFCDQETAVESELLAIIIS